MRAMRFCCLVLAMILSGCGPAGPRRVPVWGDVAFEGSPLEKGDIVFTPIEGTGGPSTGGEIVDGKYQIDAASGPVAGGSYKVEIKGLRKTGKTTPNLMVPGGPPLDLWENPIPDIYNHKSTLTVTISPTTSENKKDFLLDRK